VAKVAPRDLRTCTVRFARVFHDQPLRTILLSPGHLPIPLMKLHPTFTGRDIESVYVVDGMDLKQDGRIVRRQPGQGAVNGIRPQISAGSANALLGARLDSRDLICLTLG